MAISESLCWEVLEMAKGRSVARSWLKGSETDEPPFENAIPLVMIEHDLVLRHTKNQIEDSLYFLQKRGYLIQHGHVGLTRVVYQLSKLALDALEAGKFSEEEQNAFRETLFDLKQPGWLGMKINLGEMWRRLRRNK